QQAERPKVEMKEIRGFRSQVFVDALPELGIILISAANKDDAESARLIIEFLIEKGAEANIEIRLVELEYADATSVTNTLSQLFPAVLINAAPNPRAPLTQQPTTIQPFTGQAQPLQQQQLASVAILPLPRFNSLLLAAPAGRMKDVIAEIKRIDKRIPAK